METGSEKRYFCWLCDMVGDTYKYHLLMYKLYSRDFYSTIDMDENRSSDGTDLRDIYVDDESADYPIYRGCSILEMMIGLASRMDSDILYNSDYGDRTGEWFWMMIDNLGLDRYDDHHYVEDEVDEILDIFLDREYGTDGTGGLFPLKHPSKDQRKVEIWDQMQGFIIENLMF